ncbi:MAG TPA: energy transducer TonB [Pyrinomonadaceae bacterium]|nr:energy transducer TonB [Pyrinomonadaceae bacterium]
MRNKLRICTSIAMTLALGMGSLTALAQDRQAATERERAEQERSAQAAEASARSQGDRAAYERALVVSGAQGGSGGDYVFLATEMSFGGKLVKGAPYSGQAVTESMQTLPDGNRIINRSSAAVYRDSEGRTRREQTLKAIGPYTGAGEPPVTVYINDPVAGVSYTLDTRTHTARKLSATRFKVSTTSDEVKATADAKAAGVRVQQIDPIILERSQASAGGGGGSYKIAVEAASHDKRVVEAGQAMGITTARNRNAKNESLGKQNIGGVEAEGTRTTVTIPAGEIGNERAIEIVSERWFSPELQVIVMTKHSDPRFGENSYQLTNINRSEPGRELFEVPAGYTLKEASTGTGTGSGSGAGSGSGSGGYRQITGGNLNGKAISLPLPEYPELAKAAKASGTTTVQVTIDEEGNVISAESVSGHPLLRAVSVAAAKQAKFSPTKLSGQPVKVTGIVTYTFVAQ